MPDDFNNSNDIQDISSSEIEKLYEEIIELPNKEFISQCHYYCAGMDAKGCSPGKPGCA